MLVQYITGRCDVSEECSELDGGCDQDNEGS